jgi:hypothetical protein
MGTDELLALICVGGPIVAAALRALWHAAYTRGEAAGKKYALQMPHFEPKVVHYNAQPVRVVRRVDYDLLLQYEGDERFKQHMIAQLMEKMTEELWHHAKVEEIFDARNFQQVFRATIMLAIREGWK